MGQFSDTINSETESPDIAKAVPQQSSGLATIATGAFAIISVGGMYAVAASFINPAFGRIRIPFMRRSTHQQMKNVFKLLEGKSGTLVDLGSGDGSIVFEAAKRGFQSTGYEQNPILVYYSRYKARRLGIHNMAQFHVHGVWKADLTKYDNIVIFDKEKAMMEPLQRKLADELRIGGHVVVSGQPFPDWMSVSTVDRKLDSAWLYNRTSVNTSGFVPGKF